MLVYEDNVKLCRSYGNGQMLRIILKLIFFLHAIMHILQFALFNELNIFKILICKFIFDYFVFELSIAEFLWMSPAKTIQFKISLFVFLVPEELKFTLIKPFEILILIEIFVVLILLDKA
jgi:hypothetical protein